MVELLWYIPVVMGVLLIAGLILGQRQMAELNVFDLFTGIAIGSIAGTGIADPTIAHLPLLVAMLGLALLHYAFNWAVAKWRPFGRASTFEPMVIVQRGIPLRRALGRIHLTVADLLPMLREQAIFDLREVEYALVEPDGHISILKSGQKSKYQGLPRAVIVDGRIEATVLQDLGWDESQLADALSRRGHPPSAQVFLAMLDEADDLYVVPMEAPQDGPAVKY